MHPRRLLPPETKSKTLVSQVGLRATRRSFYMGTVPTPFSQHDAFQRSDLRLLARHTLTSFSMEYSRD